MFQYEILSMKDEACDIAKTAFDEAIGELDSLEQEDYKDATLIMQVSVKCVWLCLCVCCVGICD